MLKFQSFLSGSSGNATFVTNDRTNVLCDCGANGKYIENCFLRLGISPDKLDAIFITHEHNDHISGAGVISRRYDVPIYASKGTWSAMESVLGKIADKNKRVISPKENVKLEDMEISAFNIPHDAKEPFGYSFMSEGVKFTIATDMGYVTDEVLENLLGSDFCLIEANHDMDMLKNGSYPFYLKKRILGEKGHLSNDAAASLCSILAESGTKSIWLGHLSKENNIPELAYKTVHEALIEKNEDTELCVLPRYWIK